MTLHIAMKHQHTKFGYERLSGSKDITWTKPRHNDPSIPPPLPPTLSQQIMTLFIQVEHILVLFSSSGSGGCLIHASCAVKLRKGWQFQT